MLPVITRVINVRKAEKKKEINLFISRTPNRKRERKASFILRVSVALNILFLWSSDSVASCLLIFSITAFCFLCVFLWVFFFLLPPRLLLVFLHSFIHSSLFRARLPSPGLTSITPPPPAPPLLLPLSSPHLPSIHHRARCHIHVLLLSVFPTVRYPPHTHTPHPNNSPHYHHSHPPPLPSSLRSQPPHSVNVCGPVRL